MDSLLNYYNLMVVLLLFLDLCKSCVTYLLTGLKFKEDSEDPINKLAEDY